MKKYYCNECRDQHLSINGDFGKCPNCEKEYVIISDDKKKMSMENFAQYQFIKYRKSFILSLLISLLCWFVLLCTCGMFLFMPLLKLGTSSNSIFDEIKFVMEIVKIANELKIDLGLVAREYIISLIIIIPLFIGVATSLVYICLCLIHLISFNSYYKKTGEVNIKKAVLNVKRVEHKLFFIILVIMSYTISIITAVPLLNEIIPSANHLSFVGLAESVNFEGYIKSFMAIYISLILALILKNDVVRLKAKILADKYSMRIFGEVK